MADYIGSTSGIIKFATESDAKQFIVVTEMGVLHELKKRNPDKAFYVAGNMQVCPNMKKVTLDNIIDALEQEKPEVVMDAALMDAAHKPMIRMLELSV